MKKSLKSALIAAVLVASLAAGMVGGTYSYFTDVGAQQENGQIAAHTTVIEEPENMDLETKNAKIQNTGEVACYVRIRMSVNFDYLLDSVAISDALGTDWVYNPSDGYYYYTRALDAKTSSKVDETSDLFQKGALVIPAELTAEQTAALKKKLNGMKVTFTQESVQSVLYGAGTDGADITGYKDVWAYVDGMNE